MDEWTKAQIKEVKANINGIKNLLDIEMDKLKPNFQNIKKWQHQLKVNELSLKALEDSGKSVK